MKPAIPLLILASILSFSPLSFAGDDKPLSRLTMGPVEVPIVADTKDGIIFKLGPKFLFMKKAGSEAAEKKIDDCKLFEAQEAVTGSPEKTLELYEACLQKHPDDAGLLRAAGVMSLVLKKIDKGRAYLEKAVKADPADAYLLEQLGDAYAIEGGMEAAKNQYGLAKEKMRARDVSRLDKKWKEMESFGEPAAVKSYLLDFAGVQYRNAVVSALYYEDEVRRQELGKELKVYYEAPAGPTGTAAVVETGNLHRMLASMQAASDFVTADRAAFDIQKDAERDALKKLEGQMNRAKGDERLALYDKLKDAQAAFINKTVTREALYIVLKQKVLEEAEKAAGKAAAEVAARNAYSSITEAVKGESALDITTSLAAAVNGMYTVDADKCRKIMEEAEKEIKVRGGINIEEFLSDKPWPAKTKPKDAETEKSTKKPTEKHTEKQSAAAAQKPEEEAEGIAPLQIGDHNIDDYGFATGVDRTLFSWSPIGRRNAFAADDRQIIWFAKLSNVGKMKDAWSNGKYSIEWIAPGGQIYLRETFKPGTYNQDLLYSTLKLFELPNVPTGQWRVKVWRKKTLINDQYFQIAAAKNA